MKSKAERRKHFSGGLSQVLSGDRHFKRGVRRRIRARTRKTREECPGKKEGKEGKMKRIMGTRRDTTQTRARERELAAQRIDKYI